MIKKILLAIFLLAASAATPAQVSPEQAIISARAQSADIKNRSIELERIKRETYGRPAVKDFTPKFPEIKEDFERIQKTTSDIFQLTVAKTPINYAAILKFVSEINRRAARLRANLFSTEPDAKKEAKNTQQLLERQDIKTLLDILDKSVNSFVHNSMFQNINLLNSQDSLKARKDLGTAIEVTFAIKEKAKKAAKDDSKNNFEH